MEDRLYPTLSLGAGESPTSFVSRLASLHKIDSARIFCSDLGLNFRHIIIGDQVELKRLSDLTGADFPSLVNNAFQSGTDGWHFRNQLLLKSSVLRSAFRVCPHCIAEDICRSTMLREVAVYGRAIWFIVHLRTCPIHRAPIIRATDALISRLTHDFSYAMEGLVKKLTFENTHPAPRNLTLLEEYLSSRLDGESGKYPWLDSHEFSVVAQLCEAVGAVTIHGRDTKVNILSDDDWNSAGAAGFEIVSKGAPAICDWLGQMRSANPYNGAAHEGPQAVFGTFYKWLAFSAQNRAFDPVRELLRQHIIETFPVGPGDIDVAPKFYPIASSFPAF